MLEAWSSEMVVLVGGETFKVIGMLPLRGTKVVLPRRLLEKQQVWAGSSLPCEPWFKMWLLAPTHALP